MAKGKALFQKLKNIHLNKIQKLILLFILAGIVIGLPYVVSNQYTLHIVILCCMYCCLTCMFLWNGCLYYNIINDECEHEFFPCNVDQCGCNNIVQYASLLADTETQR